PRPSRTSPGRHPPSSSPTTPVRARGSRRSRTPRTAGWSRCAWSPRAWTCRGWRWASTPPRPRPRCSSPRPWAASCGPGRVASLMGHAAEMEAERDHVLDRRPKAGDEETGLDESLIEQANRPEQASDQLEMSFEALESEASFDRVLFDGGEYGAGGMIGSEDEQEFLGIPGLLDADQMRTVLQQQQAQQQARRQKSGNAGSPSTPGVV